MNTYHFVKDLETIGNIICIFPDCLPDNQIKELSGCDHTAQE